MFGVVGALALGIVGFMRWFFRSSEPQRPDRNFGPRHGTAPITVEALMDLRTDIEAQNAAMFERIAACLRADAEGRGEYVPPSPEVEAYEEAQRER